jgi:hypothetical protein
VYGLHTAIATYDAIIHSRRRGRNSSSQKAHESAIAGVGVGMLGVPVTTTTSTAAIASAGGFSMPWLDHAVTVRIDIHPDGRIVYAEDEQLPGRSAAWLSLDGICYRIYSTSTTAAPTTTSAPTTSTTTTTSIIQRRFEEGKDREERGLVLDRKVDLNGTLFRWNGSEVGDHAGTIQNDIDSSRAFVYGSVGNVYHI